MRIPLKYQRGVTEPPSAGITQGDLRLGKAVSMEQISTFPSLPLHLLEPDGRVSPCWGVWRVREQSRIPAPPLLTLRNLWSRKANQLVSIFSATDSVLGEAGGQTSHTEPKNCTQGSSSAVPVPVPAAHPSLLGLVTASLVTLSSPHVAQITAWLSNHWDLQQLPAIRDSRVTMAGKLQLSPQSHPVSSPRIVPEIISNLNTMAPNGSFQRCLCRAPRFCLKLHSPFSWERMG